MSFMQLEDVDVDGAIRDAGEGVAGHTRADLLRKGALTGGAILTGGAFLGMLPEIASAKPSAKQDLKILNYALTLEYLEAAFYKEAVSDGGLAGPSLEFAKLVADHEQTHVTVLRQTIKSLGHKPVSRPKFDFKGSNQGSSFNGTAFVLENTGVRAYLGQVKAIRNKTILAAAASIVTVEARHAAAIAVIIDSSKLQGKQGVTPSGAFDRASSMKTILGEVGKTGFIAG
jgi:rubrerythrin